MKVHLCFLDEDERDVITNHRMWRVHLDTRWFHLGIAFHPYSRYVSRDGRVSWIYWHRG